MEVAVASGQLLLQVLVKVETIANKWYERRDIKDDNLNAFHRVTRQYKDVFDVLEAPPAFASTDRFTNTRIDQFETCLRQNAEALEAWGKRIEEGSEIDRVKRMKQILDKCEKDATSFYDFLLTHVSPGVHSALGNESHLSNVIKGIARIVRCTGGASVANKIENVRHLQDACDEASVWFRPHECLLLIDDIWWVNGIDMEVLNALCTMLNERSRMVFTSRDRRFLGGAGSVIEFNEIEARGKLARRMLMNHGGFGEEDELDQMNEAAFEAILDLCQGLPLALGIAGASVLQNRMRKRAENKQSAWSDFYEDVVSKRKDFFDLPDASNGRDKLPKIVGLSLQVLERREDGRNYQQIFRALCVIEKHQTVPVHMLRKLWDMEGNSEAEEVVELLDTVSVVQMRQEYGCISIQLHDLILDIAIRQASEKFETQNFFRTLVCNYIPNAERNNATQSQKSFAKEKRLGIDPVKKYGFWKKLCCVSSTSDEDKIIETERMRLTPCSLFRAWWDSADDGYLYGNLCRLLERAGYAVELMWLLSKPQWIVKRLQMSGIYGVEGDIEYGTCAMRLQGRNDCALGKHLEVLGKAARMSCATVTENPYEAWFQLYGRLGWYAKQCGRTRRFIKELERHAPRPWVKASAGFLQPAGGAGIDLIHTRGEVTAVSWAGEHVVFSVHGAGGVSVARYNPKTGTCMTKEFGSGEMVVVSNHACALFSRDDRRLATGHKDGRIASYDFDANIARILVGHTGVVR
ncbi:unnamed protein product, partial [Agarophyton chilense]